MNRDVLTPTAGAAASYYGAALAKGLYRLPQALSTFEVEGAADSSVPATPDVRAVDFTALGCAKLALVVAKPSDDRTPERSVGLALWLAPDEPSLAQLSRPTYLAAPEPQSDGYRLSVAVPDDRLGRDGPRVLVQFRLAAVDGAGNPSAALTWRQISADTRSTDTGPGCGCAAAADCGLLVAPFAALGRRRRRASEPRPR